MQHHIIRSAAFFESAFYANARDMIPELSETLLLLSTGIILVEGFISPIYMDSITPLVPIRHSKQKTE